MYSFFIHSDEAMTEVLWYPPKLLQTILETRHIGSLLINCDQSWHPFCGQFFHFQMFTRYIKYPFTHIKISKKFQYFISIYQIVNFINDFWDRGLNTPSWTFSVTCAHETTLKIPKHDLFPLLFPFIHFIPNHSNCTIQINTYYRLNCSKRSFYATNWNKPRYASVVPSLLFSQKLILATTDLDMQNDLSSESTFDLVS